MNWSSKAFIIIYCVDLIDWVGLCCRWKEMADKGKANKIPLKDDDKKVIDDIQERVAQATARKEKAKTNEEKLAAAEALDEAKTMAKNVSFR